MQFDERRDAVRQRLAEKDQEIYVAAGRANTYYFSGFATGTMQNYPIVVIPEDGTATLLVSKLDAGAARNTADIAVDTPENGFAEAITDHAPDDATVLVDGGITASFYHQLRQHVSAQIDDGIAADLRMTKDAAEIKQLQAAYETTEAGLQELASAIEQAETEQELAAVLEYRMRTAGSDGTAFDTIAAIGDASAHPHHKTADAPLQEGPLLIDIGAQRQSYASDMSRTVYLGEPDDAFRDAYTAVQEAHEAAVDRLQAGTPAHEVDKAARNVLDEHGYGDRFPHSTGHGVGLDVHERPNLSKNTDQELETGMVVTIEPGVYLHDEFGVRIEDAYHITDTGADRLTTLSRELRTFPSP